jgi:hypothetical protein
MHYVLYTYNVASVVVYSPMVETIQPCRGIGVGATIAPELWAYCGRHEPSSLPSPSEFSSPEVEQGPIGKLWSRRTRPHNTNSRLRCFSSRFSKRFSSRFTHFLFPEQSQAFQAFLMARGHNYLSEFSSPEVEQGPIGKLWSRHTRSHNTHSRFKRFSSRFSSRLSSRFRRFLFPE